MTGGFVGLEMAENLVRRGISVTIIEMQNHVMPSLDYEMATPIPKHLNANGVSLHLEDAVTGLKRDDGRELTKYLGWPFCGLLSLASALHLNPP